MGGRIARRLHIAFYQAGNRPLALTLEPAGGPTYTQGGSKRWKMHKGRPYPFHPIYWATECQFWPGYIPWRFMFVGMSSSDPKATPLNHYIGQISFPGEAPDDATLAFWEWGAFLDGTDHYQLTISLEMEEYSGLKYAVYKAKLKKNFDPIYYQSWLFMPFPRYQEWTGVALWGSTHATPAVPPYSLIDIRGATYSEGGSPYP